MDNKKKCAVCKGKGKIELLDSSCPFCNGTGEFFQTHQVLINEKMPAKTVKTTCPDCNKEYETPFTFDQSNFFASAS